MTIRIPVLLALSAAFMVSAPAHVQAHHIETVASTPDNTICHAVDGRLPPNVQIQPTLVPEVRAMLQRSDNFRRQCEELAAYPKVYVRVAITPVPLPARLCARSVIQRMTEGPLMVFVEVGRAVNVAEWIAHEFEHVLEQAEGLRASDLRKQQSSWMSDGLAFETTRAIVAGRAVREQMRRKPTAMAAAN